MKFALRGFGSGSTARPEALAAVASKAESPARDHRVVVFAPGFVPRARFDRELSPTLERFAEETIARV